MLLYFPAVSPVRPCMGGVAMLGLLFTMHYAVILCYVLNNLKGFNINNIILVIGHIFLFFAVKYCLDNWLELKSSFICPNNQ